MNPYRYSISLRVRHPSMNLDAITSALNLEPFRSWRANERGSTPKGTPLSGVNRESYWAARVAEGDSKSANLPDVIRRLVIELAPHKHLFETLRREGGSIQLFVGWFFDGDSGDVFDFDLLSKMADLKIDLSLDVYPSDKQV